jgi:hypothetical protein
MPGRASKTKKKSAPAERDFTSVARRVVEQAIGERLDGSAVPEPEPDTRNQAALTLSKLGASRGGKARAKNLSPAKRKAIAKKAAKARWG